jgi:hypothetical protein
MRHSLATLLLLLCVGACKRGSDADRYLPTQAEADRRYAIDRLSSVCDGRKVPTAKPYEKGRPHQRTSCSRNIHDSGAIVGQRERWLCGGDGAAALRSLADAELVTCVDYGYSDSADVRLVAAATGEQLASVKVDLAKARYSGDQARKDLITKALAPYLE